MMTGLKLQNISVSYGDHRILKELSMEAGKRHCSMRLVDFCLWMENVM